MSKNNLKFKCYPSVHFHSNIINIQFKCYPSVYLVKTKQFIHSFLQLNTEDPQLGIWLYFLLVE